MFCFSVPFATLLFVNRSIVHIVCFVVEIKSLCSYWSLLFYAFNQTMEYACFSFFSLSLSRKIWYLWCPIHPAATYDTCRYVSSMNFWNSRPAHIWYSDTLLVAQHVCRRCVVLVMPSNTAPYHTVDTRTISWANSLEQEIHQIQIPTKCFILTTT